MRVLGRLERLRVLVWVGARSEIVSRVTAGAIVLGQVVCEEKYL